MFKQAVTKCGIEYILPNVVCESMHVKSPYDDFTVWPDDSLIQAAVLLLAPRKPDAEVKIRIEEKMLQFSNVRLCFVLSENFDEDVAACELPDECRQRDLEAFFAPRVTTAIFVTNEKSVVIIKDSSKMTFHLVVSMLPRYIPEFFEEAPLSEEEVAFLEAFTQRDINVWLIHRQILMSSECIQCLQTESFFRTVERNRRENVRSDLKTKIERLRLNAEDLIDKYLSCMSSIDSFNRELFAVENEPEASGIGKFNEALNRAASARIISDNHRDMNSIQFSMRGLLLNFPDCLESMIKNKGSVLYTPLSNVTNEDRIKLIRALFIDEVLHLSLMGTFRISMNDRGFMLTSVRTVIPEDWKENTMPNPHLHFFQCLGSYGIRINECVRKGDWDGMFSMCGASISSVNLHEIPTSSRFFNQLFGEYWEMPVLRDAFTNQLSPKEAVARLHEENGTMVLGDKVETREEDNNGETDSD